MPFQIGDRVRLIEPPHGDYLRAYGLPSTYRGWVGSVLYPARLGELGLMIDFSGAGGNRPVVVQPNWLEAAPDTVPVEATDTEPDPLDPIRTVAAQLIAAYLSFQAASGDFRNTIDAIWPDHSVELPVVCDGWLIEDDAGGVKLTRVQVMTSLHE